MKLGGTVKPRRSSETFVPLKTRTQREKVKRRWAEGAIYRRKLKAE